MDIPALMVTTPGITEKRFTKDPLGTEGELTLGPDDVNPFRSAQERDQYEAYKERLREQQTDQPRLVKVPFDDPTDGDDPFVFDDVEGEIDDVGLPGLDSTGPQF